MGLSELYMTDLNIMGLSELYMSDNHCWVYRIVHNWQMSGSLASSAWLTYAMGY